MRRVAIPKRRRNGKPKADGAFRARVAEVAIQLLPVLLLCDAIHAHRRILADPAHAEDVAATKRAIVVQEGPVLLVGHSYGGVVITEAGNDPKVAGIVYVAAFAPDANQSIGEISQTFPKPPGLDELRPLPDGYLLLSPTGIEEDFTQDVTADEKALLVAVQPQTAGAIFEAKPRAAAWRSKPSWYVVASKDRMIAPEQEQAMAQGIGAKATSLPSSHAVMLSHAKEVADVIADAAHGAAAR